MLERGAAVDQRTQTQRRCGEGFASPLCVLPSVSPVPPPALSLPWAAPFLLRFQHLHPSSTRSIASAPSLVILCFTQSFLIFSLRVRFFFPVVGSVLEFDLNLIDLGFFRGWIVQEESGGRGADRHRARARGVGSRASGLFLFSIPSFWRCLMWIVSLYD